MVTWNNLDTLASFKELEEAKKVQLAEVMSGENGAERVKNTVCQWQRGLHIITGQSRWMTIS